MIILNWSKNIWSNIADHIFFITPNNVINFLYRGNNRHTIYVITCSVMNINSRVWVGLSPNFLNASHLMPVSSKTSLSEASLLLSHTSTFQAGNCQSKLLSFLALFISKTSSQLQTIPTLTTVLLGDLDVIWIYNKVRVFPSKLNNF